MSKNNGILLIFRGKINPGGELNMPSIKCSVTECAYNSNVMCDAPMIQVNHSGAEESSSSEETQCDTFKPKHQQQ